MIKRPKNTDTEKDIFQMQKEFLMEKKKDSNFQPAAKVVKLSKPSKFAQSRATVNQSAADEPMDDQPSSSASAGIQPKKYIIGDIVERRTGAAEPYAVVDDVEETKQAFPSANRVEDEIKAEQSQSGLSLFALSQLKKANKPVPMDVLATPSVQSETFGTSSCILRNDKNNIIHKENVEFLKQHSEDDILCEQQRLLGTMDPDIVNFLRQRRAKAATLDHIPETAASSGGAEVNVAMPPVDNTLPDLDIFQHDDIKKWMHFDVVETEKLQWMRDLPANMPKLKPGETYEARFDWKGVLLPFNMKPEDGASSDLYLHGDDAQRPGYTLQELFRLARSTVMQQRTAALSAIGGIISIYNQGFYDNILEVPISKIFFLLRYALDDNTPAMLDVASKALSILVYNQTDEILLDLTFDSSTELVEPTLCVDGGGGGGSKNTETVDQELDEKFAQLNLTKQAFQTNVDDDDENDAASMNDFHLAERDLIRCLLRANILQRISYILATLNFDNSTISNCVKILIRIARTSELSVDSIIAHGALMDNVFGVFNHTPLSTEVRMHSAAKAAILKLCRIIMSHGERYVDKLRCNDIEGVLRSGIYLQENSITAHVVKVHIEACRCAKVYICITKNHDYYNDLMPALQYSLEWIYQFLHFEQSDQFLYRQCASALVSLIAVNTSAGQIFAKLPICFSKWFAEASKATVDELSQIVLLATCLNAMNESTDIYSEFFDTYFKTFLDSAPYRKLCESLSKTSSLLSKNRLRPMKHDPLPDLNSVKMTATSLPSLVVSASSVMQLFDSLARLSNAKQLKLNRDAFTALWFNDSLRAYVTSMAGDINRSFITNWFVRTEVQFIVELLKSAAVRSLAGDKPNLLKLTFKIVTCLSEHQMDDLLFLLNNIVFNIDYYSHKCIFRQTSVNHWNSTYVKIIMQKYFIRLNAIDRPSPHNFDRETILARDWPCAMVKSMYEMANAGRAFAMAEHEVIRTTFSFLSLINANHIGILTPAEQLVYTMMAFLGKDCTFLEEELNSLLATFVRTSFAPTVIFDLDNRIADNINFENLYIAFLDQFQGASYGNKTFGALVLAPLAQRYNIKWRQMVWSEHAAVLRFIQCAEADLIGRLVDYTEPVETDRTLLKSYFQAIHSNILVSGSIVHRIATHHVDAYRAKMGKAQQGAPQST